MRENVRQDEVGSSGQGETSAGKVAGGVGVGALISGIAGGGKGAWIGAAAGGATGSATSAVTNESQLSNPGESLPEFRLEERTPLPIAK